MEGKLDNVPFGTVKDYTNICQGRTIGGGGCGGVRHPPPNIFRAGPKFFLINEKSVHDKAWIVRIQVGPTSECSRQRSVHDDS